MFGRGYLPLALHYPLSLANQLSVLCSILLLLAVSSILLFAFAFIAKSIHLYCWTISSGHTLYCLTCVCVCMCDILKFTPTIKTECSYHQPYHLSQDSCVLFSYSSLRIQNRSALYFVAFIAEISCLLCWKFLLLCWYHT